MTIRRKLSLAKPAAETGVDRVWRMALARAARDELQLALAVTDLSVTSASLAEVLERMPEHALLSLLEGPTGGMGLIALSPDVLAAMTEVQTTGFVSDRPAPIRKPTRTDAALVADLIDLALQGLEGGLAADVDLPWAGGFRYHSFLPDPRPLALLLEDFGYRILMAQVSLGDAAKRGEVMLVLPAIGRGKQPDIVAEVDEGFADRLAEQVLGVDAVMEAVLYRMTIPLSAVMSLRVGEMVPLPAAALETITIEGEGRRLAQGRLGQNRGMRAVRLAESAPEDNVIPLRAAS